MKNQFRLSLGIGLTILLGACAAFGDGDVPTAAEMGAATCEPAGPHDAAAPGEWICEGESGSDRVQPRHRVEN